jgi:hypothetical protein
MLIWKGEKYTIWNDADISSLIGSDDGMLHVWVLRLCNFSIFYIVTYY